MQILRKGKLPSERTHDTTCRECQSLLRVKPSDGALIADFRDGDCIQITCPVCKMDMYISTKFFQE